jgi:hypothetical protein
MIKVTMMKNTPASDGGRFAVFHALLLEDAKRR